MTESVGAGAVVITTAQIFTELRGLHDQLRDMRADVRTAINHSDDHESRIRALERKLWIAAGGAMVAGALVGAAVTLFIWGWS